MDIQRVCCEYFRQWKFGSLGTLHTVGTWILGTLRILHFVQNSLEQVKYFMIECKQWELKSQRVDQKELRTIVMCYKYFKGV